MLHDDGSFRLPVIADNQNAELCTPCGGKCCKRAPGKYVPSDFGENKDEIIANVRAALAVGTTALDYYEAHDDIPDIYFPRPAIVGHEGKRVHASWGGQCTHLQPTGCAISFERRPFQCRILQPGAGSVCIMPTEYSTTWDIASMWVDYQLERLADGHRRAARGLEALPRRAEGTRASTRTMHALQKRSAHGRQAHMRAVPHSLSH